MSDLSKLSDEELLSKLRAAEARHDERRRTARPARQGQEAVGKERSTTMKFQQGCARLRGCRVAILFGLSQGALNLLTGRCVVPVRLALRLRDRLNPQKKTLSAALALMKTWQALARSRTR
jgi:hypothetical protein